MKRHAIALLVAVLIGSVVGAPVGFAVSRPATRTAVPTVPSAPRSVKATGSSDQASISWTIPATSGGSAILSYTVTSTPGSKTCTYLVSSPETDACTVTGLANGTSYTFSVTATNAVGTSVASAPSKSVTPATIPGAPTAVTAAERVAGAVVSWQLPATNGGSAIKRFTATATPGGATCSVNATSSTTDACTVKGLVNGQSYTFTVTATNAVGTSPASAPSPQVVPLVAPTAPLNVTGTPGEGAATVAWVPGSSSPANAPASFIATAFPGGATCSVSTSVSTAHLCTINALSIGVSYTFTVVATNASGTSPTSRPSTKVTPYFDAPGTPTSVSAISAGTQATVSWNPPSSNGGTAITEYVATASPGGASCTYVVVTPETDQCAITGLSIGQGYTFTVTATNAVGTGSASAPSSTVTPSTTPVPPTSVTAVAGNRSATISWSGANAEGSPITGFQVSDGAGDGCTTTGATTCTVTGLTNGTSYSFSVTATNANGTSQASAASSAVTPSTVPDQPTGLVVTPGNTSVVVAWSAANNEGSPITGYRVSDGAGDGCSTTGATTCTVTGLTNGTGYTFTVTATNANGTGSASAQSSTATPSTTPVPPTSVTAVAGNRSAAVSWSGANAEGSPITGYRVSDGAGDGCSTTGATTCTVTGLTNGTSYSFSVTATNANGTSQASAASSAVTPSTVPDQPTGLVVTSGNTSVTVAWSAANAEGSPITSYRVSDGTGDGCSTTGATTCTVTGLTNGTSYSFSVTATNANGTGLASAPSSAVTPSTTPGAPTAVNAVAGNGQAIISWNPPSSNGGAAITEYVATASPGGTSCTYSVVAPEVDQCTVTGLTNGTSYSFSVTSTNANGTSSSSASSSSVVPSSMPGTPTSVMAMAGNRTAVVSWSPANNEGSPITSYRVTSSPGSKTCTYLVSSPETDKCTVTGLTNGTSYSFSVTATNANGTSQASAGSSSVTPSTVPDQPTGLVVTTGNQSVVVAWSAANNEGSPITSYRVSDGTGDGCSTTGATTCTVTGLTNGTSYSFSVTATNANGTSQASTPSSGTPSTTPGAPTSVVATAGAGQAFVSWNPPSSNGGAGITEYVATASPGAESCIEWVSQPETDTCIVTGLTNGIAYSITVTAANAAGTGSPSSAASVTPVPYPGDPTYVALGDSYTSGSWNPGPTLSTTDVSLATDDGCDRTPGSYPTLVNSWLDTQDSIGPVNFSFLACNGATSTDLWAGSPAVSDGFFGATGDNGEGHQLSDTTDLANAEIVTVEIGGDDLGFTPVMQSCLVGFSTAIDCGTSSPTAATRNLAANIQTMKSVLIATYRQIEAEAPGAKLYVLGYPDLLPPNPTTAQKTNGCGGFLPQAFTYLSPMEASIGTVISQAAASAGAIYVDPNPSSGSNSFLGHDVCSSTSWFNTLLHPNLTGQAAMAAVLEAAIAAHGVGPG